MAGQATTLYLRTFLFTAFALIAFASNSVLCRLALGGQAIDASSFTMIRLLSGCIMLLGILKFTGNKRIRPFRGSWKASAMLFLYAVTFSFAYITLDTGTGALILFGAVQMTIIIISVASGDKLQSLEWVGLLTAFTGFVYLVLPGVSKPSLSGFILMSAAGMGWGIYTLIGRGSENPLSDTAWNFTRALPFFIVVAIIVCFTKDIRLSQKGVILAMVSGAITSGIGYAVWYAALRGLSAIQAGVVQLFVPVIAALGGVVFVSEEISLRLIVSAILILGGITLVVLGRSYFYKPGKK